MSTSADDLVNRSLLCHQSHASFCTIFNQAVNTCCWENCSPAPGHKRVIFQFSDICRNIFLLCELHSTCNWIARAGTSSPRATEQHSLKLQIARSSQPENHKKKKRDERWKQQFEPPKFQALAAFSQLENNPTWLEIKSCCCCCCWVAIVVLCVVLLVITREFIEFIFMEIQRVLVRHSREPGSCCLSFPHVVTFFFFLSLSTSFANAKSSSSCNRAPERKWNIRALRCC